MNMTYRNNVTNRLFTAGEIITEVWDDKKNMIYLPGILIVRI